MSDKPPGYWIGVFSAVVCWAVIVIHLKGEWVL
jgi:hypothetical protein